MINSITKELIEEYLMYKRQTDNWRIYVLKKFEILDNTKLILIHIINDNSDDDMVYNFSLSFDKMDEFLSVRREQLINELLTK